MPIKRVRAPRIDFSVLRRELTLPGEFSAEALAEAEAAGQMLRAAAGQMLPAAVDQRDVPFVTADPATSRDLDQAMHLRRRPGGGFRVRCAIAAETCLALFEAREVPVWAREALPRRPTTMADSDRTAGGAARAPIDLTEAVLLEPRVGETFDAPSNHRPQGGSIAVDDPAVRARRVGSLPLGERISVRLDTADPATRKVLFSCGTSS